MTGFDFRHFPYISLGPASKPRSAAYSKADLGGTAIACWKLTPISWFLGHPTCHHCLAAVGCSPDELQWLHRTWEKHHDLMTKTSNPKRGHDGDMMGTWYNEKQPTFTNFYQLPKSHIPCFALPTSTGNRHFWVPGLLVPTQRGQVQRGVALVVLGVDVQTSAALHDGTAALGALGDGYGGFHRRSPKSSMSLDSLDHFSIETHGMGVLGSIIFRNPSYGSPTKQL